MTSLAGNVNHENGIFRLEANFSPSLWGNTFSNSTRINQVNICIQSNLFIMMYVVLIKSCYYYR